MSRKHQLPPTTDPRKYAWMIGAAQQGDIATPLTAIERDALIEVCKSGDLFKVIRALDAIIEQRTKPKKKK